MDAVTHSLAAAALWRSRLLPRSTGTWGALALLIAANAADMERAIQLVSTPAYIRNYHGAAHSFVGGILIAAVIAAIATWGLRRARRKAVLAELFLVSLAGCCLHLLLDGFQGYGERLFWPASNTRYVLPLLADYDLAGLVILFLALIVPIVLNSVNSEIGARRIKASRFAIGGLLIVAALLPVRYYWRSRADYAASTVLFDDTQSYAVHPSPFLPWRWYLVQDTPLSYLLMEVDASASRVLSGSVRVRKPSPNNVFIAARETDAGREFLDMAAYPLFTLDEGRKGMLVRVRDMKFYLPGGGIRPYSLEVEVTSEGKVLSERAVF